MYKNLSAAGLGISGRLSELIELTLTHRFKGFDYDLAELITKGPPSALEQARRLLASAKIEFGGFELPVRWRGAEADYKADLAGLDKVAEAAAALGALRTYTMVLPTSDYFPYHENFELHRKRIAETAEVLGKHGIDLGLGFDASAAARVSGSFQFIHESAALLLLIDSIRLPNVGLALDTWHWHVGGGTLDQLRELDARQLVLVRLAGLPEDVEPAAATDEQRVLPGEGVGIDHAALLSHLSTVGYEGPVTIYVNAGAFPGLKRDAVVQKAAAVLEGLLTAAGVDKTGQPLVAV